MKNLQTKSADWRASLQQNQRRTLIVIVLFFAIYLGLGLLIDIFMIMQTTGDDTAGALSAITTGQIFPYATLFAAVAAGLGLLITYMMHDKLMLLGTQYVEVTANNPDPDALMLYHVVEEMVLAAGLRYMPKIYIIEADYMNAFASGYSEKSAMLAITRGLMQKLNRAELQAVMAHELSHIRHQDIKLTLTASVLSSLILIVLDMVFYKLMFSGAYRERRNNNQQMIFIVIMILRYVMPIVTLLLMMYLSRTREYMADAGAVELTRSNEPLASALLKIHQDHTQHIDEQRAEYDRTAHEEVRRAAYLYDPSYAGINAAHDLSSMFSTHPPLKARLKALGVEMVD